MFLYFLLFSFFVNFMTLPERFSHFKINIKFTFNILIRGWIFLKVLYVNPAGANPTGVSIPLERRQEIYQIAKDFDLIIFEDDPYYFLQFDEVIPPQKKHNYFMLKRKNSLQERTPSFLSIDTDGRVVRFDSLSKVLSSGIRLGYVTGPRALIEPISYHMQVSVLHASSLSQVQ